MTMGVEVTPRVKGYLIQILMLLLINVPTISFGLAMGWVSLASGEGGEGAEGSDVTLVGAAAATFAAGLLGVPLGARALQAGRKRALIATSAAFAVCWSLKLAGGWGVVAGRLVAGVAGSAAWCISPLLAREMCSARVRGAAVAALVLAHNLGILLMYLAGDAGVQHRTVVVWCLGLSVVHCITFLFAPESPSFLAAQGKHEEARAAVAWLRGVDVEHPSLVEELQALPPSDEQPVSPLQLTKEMLSDHRRRRAFIIALVAVVGQEACGVLSLVQFAERVFVLARDEGAGAGAVLGAGGEGELATPARHALLIGIVQFLASAVALYLVERVGRRPLLIFGAVSTGLCLALGAEWVGAGRGGWGAGGALCAAVGADSLALQPAPYALLADMFHYQYRGCAVLLVTVAACVGNTAETLVFPLVARSAGLWAALALAATATLFYALFAIICVPETRGRSPEEIYEVICPEKSLADCQKDPELCHNVKSDSDEKCQKDPKHLHNINSPSKLPGNDCQEDLKHTLQNRNLNMKNDDNTHKVSTTINGLEAKNCIESCKESHTTSNQTTDKNPPALTDVTNQINYDVTMYKKIKKFDVDSVLSNNTEQAYNFSEVVNGDFKTSNENTNNASLIINERDTPNAHSSSNCKNCLKRTSSVLSFVKPSNEHMARKQNESSIARTIEEVCKSEESSASEVRVETLQTNEQCFEETQCTKM